MGLLKHEQRWARPLAWGALAVIWAVALARIYTAPERHPQRRLAETERVALGEAARQAEPQWRVNTMRRFPQDLWSQEDDFHATERQWAVTAAAQRNVPVSDVFRAVDEDLRRHEVSPPRKANASPIKPRAYYE